VRIDRLLALVVLLLDRDVVSARVLASRFGVSVRTVQRDAQALALAGIPVYSLPGAQGGYAIVPEFKLHNRVFSRDDLKNLVTAVRGVQGAFADGRFDGVLEQVNHLVPPTLVNEVNESQETLVIDFSLGGDTVLAEKIHVLEAAIARRHPVRCRYTGHRDLVDRVVEPLTLVLQWGSWYLYAYCRLRDDYRLFRVSRMADLAVVPQPFRRRPKTYRQFRDERPDFGAPLVDLVFRAHPSVRALVEEHHTSQEITLEGDSVVVRCRQPDEPRLYRYLLGYGDAVEVLSPPAVREKVRQIAQNIASSPTMPA